MKNKTQQQSNARKKYKRTSGGVRNNRAKAERKQRECRIIHEQSTKDYWKARKNQGRKGETRKYTYRSKYKEPQPQQDCKNQQIEKERNENQCNIKAFEKDNLEIKKTKK